MDPNRNPEKTKMTEYRIAVLLSAAILAGGCVPRAVQHEEVKQAIEIVEPSKVKPVAITKIAAKIRRGTVVGELGVGAFCVKAEDVKWAIWK